MRALAVTLLAATGLALTPSVAAVAASTDVHGADVSWPQCGGPLPTGVAFGVVGVNTGVGIDNNPCLSDELTWASGTAGVPGQPATSLYVMTEDPGQAATWWPDSDSTQHGATVVAVPSAYGSCAPAVGTPALGEESDACAYVYGYSIAQDDVTVRHIAHPAAYQWWIDVEKDSNTWADETSHNPSDSRTRNRAVIEGMVAAFLAAGVHPGIYSTAYQWNLIAGSIPSTSPLAKLPNWIASTEAIGSAQSNCYSSGFTPGSPVKLAQYQAGGADYDLACHRLTASPKPTVTGTTAVDQTLTAHAGTWTPSPVTLHYRWNRDAKPIAGATGSTYRTVAADAGHAITVTVTGTKSGWTTIARTSSAHPIAVPVSRLAASHTLGTGKSLLAPNGRYRLTQQSDGNLVLYKDTGKALWNSHRFGKSYSTTMQADGNLVTYTPAHHAVWATRTNGKHATYAVMQSDGNFVLYTAAGRAVWATRTNGR